MDRRVLIYTCAIFFTVLPYATHVEAAPSLERLKSFVSRLRSIGSVEFGLQTLGSPRKFYEKMPLSVVYAVKDGTKSFTFWKNNDKTKDSNKIATLELTKITIVHDGGGKDGKLMTIQYTDKSSTLTYYIHFQKKDDFEYFAYMIDSKDFS